MPVQTRSQTKAIKSQIRNETITYMIEDWFKKSMNNYIKESERTKGIMNTLRVINEMFSIIDEYFYDIFRKNRNSEKFWRLAKTIHIKTIEFSLHDFDQYDLNDVELIFVKNFRMMLKKVSQNLKTLFQELDLNVTYHLVKFNSYNVLMIKEISD